MSIDFINVATRFWRKCEFNSAYVRDILFNQSKTNLREIPETEALSLINRIVLDALPKLTQTEQEALELKAENPSKIVFCPRCQQELVYYKSGNSYCVECPTERCIILTVRGI